MTSTRKVVTNQAMRGGPGWWCDCIIVCPVLQLFRAQLGASTARGHGALWQAPRLWGNGEACRLIVPHREVAATPVGTLSRLHSGSGSATATTIDSIYSRRASILRVSSAPNPWISSPHGGGLLSSPRAKFVPLIGSAINAAAQPCLRPASSAVFRRAWCMATPRRAVLTEADIPPLPPAAEHEYEPMHEPRGSRLQLQWTVFTPIPTTATSRSCCCGRQAQQGAWDQPTLVSLTTRR